MNDFFCTCRPGSSLGDIPIYYFSCFGFFGWVCVFMCFLELSRCCDATQIAHATYIASNSIISYQTEQHSLSNLKYSIVYCIQIVQTDGRRREAEPEATRVSILARTGKKTKDSSLKYTKGSALGAFVSSPFSVRGLPFPLLLLFSPPSLLCVFFFFVDGFFFGYPPSHFFLFPIIIRTQVGKANCISIGRTNPPRPCLLETMTASGPTTSDTKPVKGGPMYQSNVLLLRVRNVHVHLAQKRRNDEENKELEGEKRRSRKKKNKSIGFADITKKKQKKVGGN